MATPLHQLYCTHCTYGTSALERHVGAIKDQVFEYSARATSVPRQECHNYFRRLERYLYFHLPADAPPTSRLEYTAHTAPWRRLVYLPAVAGLRVVQHVCYRQTDTSGRPGSYFSHVLVSDATQNGNSWSALDALKLWNADDFWVIEDRADHPFDLDQIPDLRSLPGYGTAINDDVLVTFLTAAPEKASIASSIANPLSPIPERWRTRPVEERRRLFLDVLQGILSIDSDRKERVVLAVESGLAALLFYGVLRLLPESKFREQVSFSTFESCSDKLMTTLTACDFLDRNTADFPHEWYRGSSVVINTFKDGKRSPALKSPSRFAEQAVAAIAASVGLSEVDKLIPQSDLEIRTARDLEQWFGQQEIIVRLVRPVPDEPIVESQLPPQGDPRLKAIQQGVTGKLASMSVESDDWRRLATVPGHLTLLLRILGSDDQRPEAVQVIDRLLSSLSADEVVSVVADSRICGEYRATLLCQTIRNSNQLPAGCDAVWSSPDLLREFLARLPADKLLSVLGVEASRREASPPDYTSWLRTVLKVVLKVPSNSPMDRENVLNSLIDTSRVNDNQLLELMIDKELSPLLISEPALKARLGTLMKQKLDELPSNEREFVSRLEFLKRHRDLLVYDSQRCLDAWNQVYRRIREVHGVIETEQGIWARLNGGRERQRQLEEYGKKLAQAAESAFSRIESTTIDIANRRVSILNRLAVTATGSELPEVVREGLSTYFSRRFWPIHSTTNNTAEKPVARDSAWKSWTLFCVITVLGLGGLLWGGMKYLADKKSRDIQVADRTTDDSSNNNAPSIPASGDVTTIHATNASQDGSTTAGSTKVHKGSGNIAGTPAPSRITTKKDSPAAGNSDKSPHDPMPAAKVGTTGKAQEDSPGKAAPRSTLQKPTTPASASVSQAPSAATATPFTLYYPRASIRSLDSIAIESSDVVVMLTDLPRDSTPKLTLLGQEDFARNPDANDSKPHLHLEQMEDNPGKHSLYLTTQSDARRTDRLIASFSADPQKESSPALLMTWLTKKDDNATSPGSSGSSRLLSQRAIANLLRICILKVEYRVGPAQVNKYVSFSQPMSTVESKPGEGFLRMRSDTDLSCMSLSLSPDSKAYDTDPKDGSSRVFPLTKSQFLDPAIGSRYEVRDDRIGDRKVRVQIQMSSDTAQKDNESTYLRFDCRVVDEHGHSLIDVSSEDFANLKEALNVLLDIPKSSKEESPIANAPNRYIHTGPAFPQTRDKFLHFVRKLPPNLLPTAWTPKAPTPGEWSKQIASDNDNLRKGSAVPIFQDTVLKPLLQNYVFLEKKKKLEANAARISGRLLRTLPEGDFVLITIPAPSSQSVIFKGSRK